MSTSKRIALTLAAVALLALVAASLIFGATQAATLTTIPVRDNRIYEIRTMVDGYYTGRSTYYYRRLTGNGVYTGPAPVGSVHGFIRVP